MQSPPLHARYGSLFATEPYAPWGCHQHEIDDESCPSGWEQYAPLLLELVAAAPPPSTGTLPATRVSCGNHDAERCSECPQGNGQAWCNGECVWDAAWDECKYPGVDLSNPSAQCEVEFVIVGGGFIFRPADDLTNPPISVEDRGEFKGPGGSVLVRGITDAEGKVSLWWIAGGASTAQTVTATAKLSDGSTSNAAVLQGIATPHTADPQGFRGERSTRSPSTHAMFNSKRSAEGRWSDWKIELEPKHFPQTTFFMAIAQPGYYSGVQNINGWYHQVIFSCWQLGGVDSYPIDYGADSTCSQFGGEGTGWKCTLPITFEHGQRYQFHLQRAAASPTAVGKNGLGLWPSPTAASKVPSVGIDISLWIAVVSSGGSGSRSGVNARNASELGEPTFVATFRSPITNLLEYTGASSFVENWGTHATSCTAHDQRSVEYRNIKWRKDDSGSDDVDVGWHDVREATFASSIVAWHNEICVNYAYGVVQPPQDSTPRFFWSTGGQRCQSAPMNPTGGTAVPAAALDGWSAERQAVQLQGDSCFNPFVPAITTTTTTVTTTQDPRVSCGNHKAESCFECPEGNGQAWCNGDCVWDPGKGLCKLPGHAPCGPCNTRRGQRRLLYA